MNQVNFLKIGDVSRTIDVPTHTIRYWEKEFFEFLHPQRGNGSRRKYGEYDVELLIRIKKMVWEEKYSIAGARQKLKNILIGKDTVAQDNTLLSMMEIMKANQTAGIA